MPLADMFWGERNGNFLDPFGYLWSISSKIEDVSEEEIIIIIKRAE